MCNSLEAMLQVKKGKENAVIKKINKNRQSFPKIRKVEKYNDNHVIVSYLDSRWNCTPDLTDCTPKLGKLGGTK